MDPTRLHPIDRYFGISKQGSTWPREVRAGVTTFVTMAYILFVNPLILGAAIRPPDGDYGPQLLAATALAAAFSSLAMGLVGRNPYALAPGMGLNAYFAYTVVLGRGIPWQTALGAVFISGLLFLVISALGVRRLLLEAIPRSLKYAVTAGIGAFLAMLGLKNGGLVVAHPATLVHLGPLTDPSALLALGGLLLTVVFCAFKVRGAILWGILATSAIAVVLRLPVYPGGVFAGFGDGLVRAPVLPGALLGALDLRGALELGVLGIVFTFLFVDFFDTAGTLVALSEKSGRVDASGNMLMAGPAFVVDGLATAVGALLGTSSTTSYIESAAGIEEGGRTGLVSVTVACLFVLSLFCWPLLGAVPQAATAPALIIVGAMMLYTLRHIAWDDMTESVPALLVVLGMPLTFSITNGLALGLIFWCLARACVGRAREVHPLMYVVTLLLILRFAFLGDQ